MANPWRSCGPVIGIGVLSLIGALAPTVAVGAAGGRAASSETAVAEAGVLGEADILREWERGPVSARPDADGRLGAVEACRDATTAGGQTEGVAWAAAPIWTWGDAITTNEVTVYASDADAVRVIEAFRSGSGTCVEGLVSAALAQRRPKPEAIDVEVSDFPVPSVGSESLGWEAGARLTIDGRRGREITAFGEVVRVGRAVAFYQLVDPPKPLDEAAAQAVEATVHRLAGVLGLPLAPGETAELARLLVPVDGYRYSEPIAGYIEVAQGHLSDDPDLSGAVAHGVSRGSNYVGLIAAYQYRAEVVDESFRAGQLEAEAGDSMATDTTVAGSPAKIIEFTDGSTMLAWWIGNFEIIVIRGDATLAEVQGFAEGLTRRVVEQSNSSAGQDAPLPPAATGTVVYSSTPDMFDGKSADYEIWSVDADGDGPKQLTDDRAEDRFPDLSPDGTRIVWASDRSGPYAIYVMNADGTDARRLAKGKADDQSTTPVWSPDGTRIAFTSGGPKAAHLFVMNADGSGVTQVSDTKVQWSARPAWSPDGTMLMFTSPGMADDSVTSHLFVVGLDGSGERRVTSDDAEQGEPAWSPDGSTIAYFSGDAAGVWLMGVDGSNPRDAAAAMRSMPDWELLSSFQPAWSPDGTALVFVIQEPGHSELYVVAADGSGLRPLTRPAQHKGDEAPSWG